MKRIIPFILLAFMAVSDTATWQTWERLLAVIVISGIFYLCLMRDDEPC